MPASPSPIQKRSEALEYQRPSSAPLLPLLGVSIVCHLAALLAVSAYLSRTPQVKLPDTLDLGIDVQLGETVQELIVAAANPEPPTTVPPLPAPPPGTTPGTTPGTAAAGGQTRLCGAQTRTQTRASTGCQTGAQA